MPWKSSNPTPTPARSSPALEAAARVRSRTGSKSIRGHISSPIPIPDALDEELTMRARDAPYTTPAVPLVDNTDSTVEPAPPENTDFSAPGVQDVDSDGKARDSHVWPNISTSEPIEQSTPEPITNTGAAFSESTTRVSTPSSRPKSGFRRALSKLFGRKKTDSSKRTPRSSMVVEEPTKQHRSDPTGNSHPPRSPGPKRPESLPLSEYARALRSHSVGPEDVLAIQSARNSINAEQNLTRRRAATTAAHPASARWTKPVGLTPRPASIQDWSSRLVDATHDPDEIGRAITTGLKRRSRSLSFIPHINTALAGGVTRRRSHEVFRPWRESYDPDFMSPVSSSAPEFDVRSALTADKPEPNTDEIPRSPIKPFPFVDITYMSEMANMNMKITEAATLDTRISCIENRLDRAEDLLTRVCHPERSAPSIPADSPRPSSQSSSAQDSGDSKLSFGEAPTFVGSFNQQTTINHLIFEAAERSTSPTTMRETSSFPMLSKQLSGPFTIDHYATLMAFIETERSARLALEAQVRKLSYQINILTRNPSHIGDVRESGLPAGQSLGGMSAFDFDDDDDDDDDDNDDLETKDDLRNLHRRSVAVIIEDSSIAPDAAEDGEEYPESFSTPHEDSHSFSAFTEDADSVVVASAMTLSLSKLSMLGGMTALPMTVHQGPPQAI